MSQLLEGHTETYIIKEADLRETLGLAKYLRRTSLQIKTLLTEFEDILDYKGDHFMSTGYKLKYDELREATRIAIKELTQSPSGIDHRRTIKHKNKELTQVEEPPKKVTKWE